MRRADGLIGESSAAEGRLRVSEIAGRVKGAGRARPRRRAGTIDAMLEIGIVLAAVVAAGLAGVLGALTAPGPLAAFGLIVLLAGLVLGLPTGLWYHVVLHRFVSTRVRLGRTWWLSPSALHRHLTDDEERRVRIWYRLGGVGFVLCVAGGVAAIAGSLLARW